MNKAYIDAWSTWYEENRERGQAAARVLTTGGKLQRRLSLKPGGTPKEKEVGVMVSGPTGTPSRAKNKNKNDNNIKLFEVRVQKTQATHGHGRMRAQNAKKL